MVERRASYQNQAFGLAQTCWVVDENGNCPEVEVADSGKVQIAAGRVDQADQVHPFDILLLCLDLGIVPSPVLAQSNPDHVERAN